MGLKISSCWQALASPGIHTSIYVATALGNLERPWVKAKLSILEVAEKQFLLPNHFDWLLD